MKPKTDQLKNVIKHSEKISFGIDYLRINLTNVKCMVLQYNDYIVKSLDFDNSNFLHTEEFGYSLTAQKINLSQGPAVIFSYSYFGVSVPIFIIQKYNSNNRARLNSLGKIDFYGSFFRLKEIGIFDDNFIFGDLIKDYKITRIDFRIDFFNYKGIRIGPEIIKARSNAFYNFYRTGGEINSWKYGQRQNKTLLVRGYDKKLDIDKKGKFRLYGDYQNYDNIWRLEYEFLNRFCNGYTLGTLNNLVNKIKSYIGIFDIDFSGKYLIPYEKLDLSDEFAKTRYCKLMSSYIKQALINNINVYDFVDIELEKLGLSKKDIEKLRKGSINIKEFNLLNN